MTDGEWMEVAREYWAQECNCESCNSARDALARFGQMVAEETNDYVRYEGSGNPLTKSDRTKIIARLLARLKSEKGT